MQIKKNHVFLLTDYIAYVKNTKFMKPKRKHQIFLQKSNIHLGLLLI